MIKNKQSASLIVKAKPVNYEDCAFDDAYQVSDIIAERKSYEKVIADLKAHADGLTDSLIRTTNEIMTQKKRADGLENKLRSPKYKELSKLIITHEHAECIDEVNRLHEGIKEIAKAPCEKCKKVQNDWEKKYRTEVFAGKDNSSRERRRAKKAEALQLSEAKKLKIVVLKLEKAKALIDCQEQELNDYHNKLEKVQSEIIKHANCKIYHSIEGKKATCLDMILLECFSKEIVGDVE